MNWNRIFFLASIAGILACVSINILAISGIFVPKGIGFIFLLMAGMTFVFVPAVLKLNKRKKERAIQPIKGIKGFKEQQKIAKEEMLRSWSPLPIGLKALMIIVTAYGFANFFLMIYLMGDYHAEYENGNYFLESHGKFLRNITESEYTQNKAYQSSMFTGHIAIFYSFAMMFHHGEKNVA
jgi:hypothetical protein